MTHHIIDRRLNPQGKSLGNRQRLLKRSKEQLRDAVKRSIQDKNIADITKGDKITIPARGLKEPTFRRSAEGGYREGVLPGNDQYVPGDTIPRPQKGGGGRGNEGSPDGEGEDEFRFVLSRDEFLDIFFEDLELPDLIKAKLKEVTSMKLQRAGYSNQGNPSNLNVKQTMRNAFGRRIALRRPKSDDIRDMELRIFSLERADFRTPEEQQELEELRLQMEADIARQKAVPYIDPLDVRYNRFQHVPQPTTQAVMFCVMDVSGSMTENHKDLAKRYFMLLYLFLQRQYDKIDVVFIRHTHEAKEVDEQEFFYGTETGGTMVSSGLELMSKIITDRYPVDDWNIYGAQASDGDNYGHDNTESMRLMREQILPRVQYYAYVEIYQPGWFATADRETDLWRMFKPLPDEHPNFAMQRITKRDEIFPVFRKLFAKI